MALPPGLWSTRDASDLGSDTEGEGGLQPSIGPVELTTMGVAAAGPAVILSFILAAVTCLFSAVSYSELAGAAAVGWGGNVKRLPRLRVRRPDPEGDRYLAGGWWDVQPARGLIVMAITFLLIRLRHRPVDLPLGIDAGHAFHSRMFGLLNRPVTWLRRQGDGP